MAKIIIEGQTVDTQEIFDIEYNTSSRRVEVVIKLIDKKPIVIGRGIPYETYPSEFLGINAPYKKLYNELKEKWEADKTELPVFKLT